MNRRNMVGRLLSASVGTAGGFLAGSAQAQPGYTPHIVIDELRNSSRSKHFTQFTLSQRAAPGTLASYSNGQRFLHGNDYLLGEDQRTITLWFQQQPGDIYMADYHAA